MKPYEKMSREEKEHHFLAALGRMAVEAGGDTPKLRNKMVICVRHFVLGADDLAKTFMRMAASACGDAVGEDGVWAECRGEVVITEALKTPQVEKA